MTNVEKEACKKMAERAIRYAKSAKYYFEKAEEDEKLKHNIDWEVHIRQATLYVGMAEGINDTLAAIGFKDECMKELCDLIVNL